MNNSTFFGQPNTAAGGPEPRAPSQNPDDRAKEFRPVEGASEVHSGEVLLVVDDVFAGFAPDAVAHVLDLCDEILVMTVNPGFGGQAYIATMEPKIRAVRQLVVESGHDVDIEVDGGIAADTVAGAAAAGANVLVAGSALFRDPDGLEHAVTDLRTRAEAAVGG